MLTPSFITELADDYAGLIAGRLGPSAHAIEAWNQLGTYMNRQADRLRHTFAVELTDDPEPYKYAADQATDLRSGRLIISRAHCDHPVWAPSTNISYRIMHDIIGHGTDGAPFTVAGEIEAWPRQLRVMQQHRCSEAVIAAAFTETIGQLAYAAVTGSFAPHQAIGFMVAFPEAPIHDDRDSTKVLS